MYLFFYYKEFKLFSFLVYNEGEGLHIFYAHTHIYELSLNFSFWIFILKMENEFYSLRSKNYVFSTKINFGDPRKGGTPHILISTS